MLRRAVSRSTHLAAGRAPARPLLRYCSPRRRDSCRKGRPRSHLGQPQAPVSLEKEDCPARYGLKADPGETVNLAGQQPAIEEQVRAALRALGYMR